MSQAIAKYRETVLHEKEEAVKKLMNTKNKIRLDNLPTAKDDAVVMLNYAFSHLNMNPKQITIMSSKEDFEFITKRVLWDS